MSCWITVICSMDFCELLVSFYSVSHSSAYKRSRFLSNYHRFSKCFEKCTNSRKQKLIANHFVSSPSHCSLLWRWLRHLLALRGWTVSGPCRLVCISFNGRPGGSDYRIACAEMLRAPITWSIVVVGGAGCIRGLHRIRHYIQSDEYNDSAAIRREWWCCDQTEAIPWFWRFLSSHENRAQKVILERHR